MNTLAEIETAAELLPPEQQRELFLFLVDRLRNAGQMPAPRDFERERIENWIADDEEGMRRFRESQ